MIALYLVHFVLVIERLQILTTLVVLILVLMKVCAIFQSYSKVPNRNLKLIMSVVSDFEKYCIIKWIVWSAFFHLFILFAIC